MERTHGGDLWVFAVSFAAPCAVLQLIA